jgi:RIO kinase 1
MAQMLSKRKRPSREDKMIKTEKRLEGDVFDRRTLFAIDKLRHDGHFETVDYPIAKGKEANVFLGTTKEGTKVAIKIYRIDTSNFVRMHEYMDGDPRFAHSRKQRFDTILAWTRKEYSNLRAFHDGHIKVPRPLAFLRNIVVMEFFGEGNIAFSELSQVGSSAPQHDYDFLINEVKKIYQLGFVHSDISEYNILVTDDGLKILDCAQAVLLAHPHADEFLARDVQNLVKFFRKQGAKTDFDAAMAYIKDGKPVLRGLEAISAGQ